ncbi:hypothetical protein [Streptomyces sp. NPDC056255]|uniref:hypothetical protein n=1 Tax=Streptomyces sp. NPDC056255 TaxID=3345764 RepID=UPI0035DD65F4
MIDLPSDLPHLRTIRAWHIMCLRAVDTAITAAEQREAEQWKAEHKRGDTALGILEQHSGKGCGLCAFR